MRRQRKLKSCPFCGSNDVTLILSLGLSWFAGCGECGARTREYKSSIDAATAWNRRADDDFDDEGSDAEDGIRSVGKVMIGMMGIPEDVSIEETPF